VLRWGGEAAVAGIAKGFTPRSSDSAHVITLAKHRSGNISGLATKVAKVAKIDEQWKPVFYRALNDDGTICSHLLAASVVQSNYH
jgi:hypothetical protein